MNLATRLPIFLCPSGLGCSPSTAKYLLLLVSFFGHKRQEYRSKTGIEYIWDGNVDVWYGQSPILFPIIGRLLDDKYRYDGKEYTMAKHGIVRKKPFRLESKTADTLVFCQSSDEDSLKSYPFEFDLFVAST